MITTPKCFLSKSFRIARSTGLPFALNAFVAVIALFVIWPSVNAQTHVPPTVILKPGFVGGKYEVSLANLLPVGTNPMKWTFSPDATAPDGTVLEKPAGIYVDSATKKLIVAPTAAALKPNAMGKRSAPLLSQCWKTMRV